MMKKYDLYIDGRRFGRYHSLQEAKGEAYCGDEFLIQEVEIVREYRKKKGESHWNSASSQQK